MKQTQKVLGSGRFYVSILQEDRRLNVFAATGFSRIYISEALPYYRKSNSWSGTGGIIYFLNQNIGLELGVSYIATKANSGKSSAQEVRVNLNLQIHLEKD